MKEDLDITNLDRDVDKAADNSISKPPAEDLTVTRAQAKVEELERELQRLKEAKAVKEFKEEVAKALKEDSEAISKEDAIKEFKEESAKALREEVASAAQTDEMGVAADKMPEASIENNPSEEPVTEMVKTEVKKPRTNAEAYASSDKNVADMLAEYDAITADDRRKKTRYTKATGNSRPQKAAHAEKAAHSERVVKNNRPERPEKAEKAAHTERPERSEKPARSEAHVRSEKMVHTEKSEREKMVRPERPEREKRTAYAGGPVRHAKAEKPVKEKHEPKRADRHIDKGGHSKKAASKRRTKDEKRGGFLSNLTGMDYVIGLTGVLVLIAAVITVSIYSTVKITEEQIASFIPVGENMAEIGIAGEGALLAMAGNREEETIVIEEEEYTVAEYDEKDDVAAGNVTVSLKLQTVVKDLKIKFVNKATGKLIPGVPFQVEITDSAKKTITKSDDDKDGIIYIKSIAPGEAKIKMVALTGYDAYALPSDVQTIIIKETLDYKKIDVADEVKTEAQVNVAAEDTAQATVTESELKDTVEWVESTKTAVSGSEGYVVVTRDELDAVPDEVKNGKPDDQARAGTFSNKIKELGSEISDIWSLKVYAQENETTTEEETTSATEPSSEAPSKPAEPSSESNDSNGEIDWNHKLTINGIRLYVDKECTTIATYKDYAKQTEFYASKGGSGATEYKYTGWQTIDGVTYFYDKDGNKITGDQVIQGAKYSFGEDGALKTGSGVLGIDVSKWNGSINWSQVKNSGISYVIIRCGYRGSTTGALIEDPTFRNNIKGAQAAGLKVGVYFFTQAVDEVEAVEEASMTLNLISGYKLSYPVFLDVEGSGGRGDKIDAATRTKVINAYCQTIRNSGYSAGVYANRTWLSEKFNPGSISGAKIWLAQYAATPTYGGSYQMWQYTSKGSVGGIKGNVDMNLSYLNY